MQDTYARKITSNLDFLCRNTVNWTHLMILLLSKRVIDMVEYQRIKHIGDPLEAHAEMYIEITKKSDKAFQLLLVCLTNSGNEELKRILNRYHWNVREENVNLEKVWFEVLPPNPHFRGRDDDLENIHKFWTENHHQKTLPLLVITGECGVGKTDLARKCVYQFREKVNGHCLWINAQTEQTTINSLRNLATKLLVLDYCNGNLPNAEIIKEICMHFKNTDCIFVFDGLGDYSERYFQIFFDNCQIIADPTTAKPFILLTSVNKHVQRAFQLQASHITLRNFWYPQIAQQFFHSVFIRHADNLDDEYANLLDQLSSVVNGHPATMVKVAGHVLDTLGYQIHEKLIDAIKSTLTEIRNGRFNLSAPNENRENWNLFGPHRCYLL